MDTVQRGPTAVTPHPHHGPVRVADIDEELAKKMARLRLSRPAAFELALATVELALSFPDVLGPYVAEHPDPGPGAPDEDLVAWAEGCRRFTAWLATDGQAAVTVDPGEVRLEVVEVPRP